MKIRCPIISCGFENEAPVSTCRKCGADLRAYAIALKFPDYCFNRSLKMAKEGDFETALIELNTCLRFRLRDEEARLLQAQICLLTGKKKSAKAILKQLAESALDTEIKKRADGFLKAGKQPGRRKRQKRKKKKKGV